MKQGYTKIIFVIDRSGSMSGIADDMMGGFKRFIQEQKKLNVGKCDVSVYEFDDICTVAFENTDINSIPDYTLIPRNTTALYDAIGKTINRIGKNLADLSEEERPEKLLTVIITDGLENSSKEFTIAKIREMIKHQTDVYNWQFSYIGANQDAWSVGNTLGFNASSTITLTPNSSGVNSIWSSLSDNISLYRSAPSSTTTDFSYSKNDIQAQYLSAATDPNQTKNLQGFSSVISNPLPIPQPEPEQTKKTIVL